jgi:hypothetical protein
MRRSLGLALLLACGLVACGDDSTKGASEPDPCLTTTTTGATGSTGPICVAVETTSTTAGESTTGGGGYNFTLTQPIPEAGGVQTQAADLTITLAAEDGVVTGTIEGPTTQQLTQPSCPSGTVVEGVTRAEVEGTLTDEALELRVVSATWQPPQVEPCSQGGLPALIGDGIPSGIFGFEESLSRLQLADDGAYRYDFTEEVAVGSAPFTVEYHVVVRFAA